MKERQNRIYEILSKQGGTTIEQLAKEVFASEATIRRDLTKMEEQGLVLRVWGGAMCAKKTDSDPPMFARSAANIKAKKQIARCAAKLVGDNMSLFLTSSTTVAELSRLLISRRNLTVITTGLDIIDTLRSKSSVRVISPGGELYENCSFAGTMTSNNIEAFMTDLFFFSCSGLTAEGFTCSDMMRTDIIRQMQKNSAKTILLVDSTKVGKTYMYRGFDYAGVDLVIMDRMPDSPELVRVLGEKLIIA